MLALALLLAPFWAAAQSVSAPKGQSAPRFQQAIEAWLTDDDATALALLSNLAFNENTAAQVMLGLIADRPKSPWLNSLPRASQNALLLVPNDQTGEVIQQSWLDVAALSGDQLATLLSQIKGNRRNEATVRHLAAIGEQTAANRLVHTISRSSPTVGLAHLGREKVLSYDAAYCGWLDGIKHKDLSKQDRALLNIAYLNNDPGAHFVASILDDGDSPYWRAYRYFFQTGLPDFKNWAAHRAQMERVGEVFANAPADNRPLASLRRFCAASCADDIPRCMALGVGLAGGYEALRTLSSPSETLIPFETYTNSPRAIADLTRHFRDLGNSWPSGTAASAKGTVACVARALRSAD